MDLALQLPREPLSRRSLLGMLGMAGVAVLGACGGGAARPSSTAPPTPARTTHTEGSLSLGTWPDDVNPDTIDLFKRRFGITDVRYRAWATDDAIVAGLAGQPAAVDVATPAAVQIPRLVEGGLIRKLDRSRIPNAGHVDAAFRGPWWDPADEYQVPKDYGTTGILYRSRYVHEPLTTWREFRALVTSGAYSGRVVFVDSMADVLAFPLKLLGVSANSVAKRDLDAARAILLEVAPHVLALDSATYGERLRSGEAVLALGWTAPLAALRVDPDAADATYVVPGEGTILWLDTWVIAAGAPHPDAAYAWLDFVHEPEVQAAETSFTGHATPDDIARRLVDPALLADPAVFPPDGMVRTLELPGDPAGSPQRTDIWEEFRAKVRHA